jgi:hypothetical protein
MKAQQNIHQLNRTAERALILSASSLWSDIIFEGSVIGFTYNNQPKQGGTGI